MKTELIITTTPAIVEANFDTIRQELQHTLESYDLIITEQTVRGGKDAMAELNKMKKLIKDRERDALEQALAPVAGFKDKVKELITLVEEAREKITKQVEIYTERTLQEIREKIAKQTTERINVAKLRVPFTIIEQEDLILMGSITKTGNLTKKVLEAIQGRVNERLTQQQAEDERLRLVKEAEEKRIALEVEKRAEQNRLEEESKAKARADEEMKRREGAIRAEEREKARQAAPAVAVPPPHHEQVAAEDVCTIADRPVIPNTPEVRRAAQEQINEEIEQHEMSQAPVPHNTVTGEMVQPLAAISVFFEIKIDTQGSDAQTVANFTREWIKQQSPEIGAEIERIGVTTPGGIEWIAKPE